MYFTSPPANGSGRTLSAPPNSDLDTRAEETLKLLRQKERVVFWLCRSVLTTTDRYTRLGILALLNDINYDMDRIKRMVELGEPGK